MKTYLVGGAVRDELLGAPSNDRDFVVVGATEEQMLDAGFKNVGESFPVFLHPEDGNEFALARREKKTGKGYTGFSVEFGKDVTLEEDLSRRDLTINAMAQDLKTLKIIDPFGGRNDLKNKILRHVGPAFSEDPLRVVRLARFNARFPDFTIAKDTLQIAQDVVNSGAMDELSNERFWAEIYKTFKQSSNPIRFFSALCSVNAIKGVKFFYDVFGDVDFFGDEIVYSSVLNQLGKVEVFDKVAVFVSLVSYNALQKGSAFPPRIKKLTSNIIKVSELGAASPSDINTFISSNRGWDSMSTHMPDVIEAMQIGEKAGFKFAIDSNTLIKCISAGQNVDIDQYMHLKGAEIGKALKAVRENKISNVLKGYYDES